MTITELVKKAHENAKKHGFWDEPPAFGTSIALIHSELSEALEEVRAGNPPVYYKDPFGEKTDRRFGVEYKPEGYVTELADAVIRIADLCGFMGIDLENAIAEKMAYNATRPYKHGKKF